MSAETSEERRKEIKELYKHFVENRDIVQDMICDFMLTIMKQNKNIRSELFPMMMIEVGVFLVVNMGIDKELLEINLKCIVEKNYEGKK